MNEAKKLCNGTILILLGLACFIKVGFSEPILLLYSFIGFAICGAVIILIEFVVNAIFKKIERKREGGFKNGR